MDTNEIENNTTFKLSLENLKVIVKLKHFYGCIFIYFALKKPCISTNMTNAVSALIFEVFNKSHSLL